MYGMSNQDQKKRTPGEPRLCDGQANTLPIPHTHDDSELASRLRLKSAPGARSVPLPCCGTNAAAHTQAGCSRRPLPPSPGYTDMHCRGRKNPKERESNGQFAPRTTPRRVKAEWIIGTARRVYCKPYEKKRRLTIRSRHASVRAGKGRQPRHRNKTLVRLS